MAWKYGFFFFKIKTSCILIQNIHSEQQTENNDMQHQLLNPSIKQDIPIMNAMI